MSFESSGAEYLRRLKQDREHPGPCHDRVVETVQTTAPAAAQKRRQSPRYKCEGSAEFRVGGSDVRTWGTFTDISLGGCYVEMTATYPVGAKVDMGLELNGVRAQVRGEVRVSYPCLGMGIAFREVSEEDRVRLQAMVRSLRPAARSAHVAPAVDTTSASSSLPIIVNVGAALQALVDFFEAHTLLTKEEFVQVLRKSHGA
jgi:PilZ domain